jgi:hypothetical protein
MEEKTTGIVFDFEKQAMRGEEMPQSLSYPERMTYLALREIYSQYKNGFIDRETAKKEKIMIANDYEILKLSEDADNKRLRIIKETEVARAEYRKKRTLEAADRLVDILDGIL